MSFIVERAHLCRAVTPVIKIVDGACRHGRARLLVTGGSAKPTPRHGLKEELAGCLDGRRPLTGPIGDGRAAAHEAALSVFAGSRADRWTAAV